MHYECEEWQEILKNSIKNCMCHYFDDIIKFKDFNLDNILIDEIIYENNMFENNKFI